MMPLISIQMMVTMQQNQIICNEPDYAVLGPNMLQKLLDNCYAEKATKLQAPIDMEAAIELISMLRQSNASLSLYNKIVKWTKQYCIKKNDVGKLPSQEAVNNFFGAPVSFGMSPAP